PRNPVTRSKIAGCLLPNAAISPAALECLRDVSEYPLQGLSPNQQGTQMNTRGFLHGSGLVIAMGLGAIPTFGLAQDPGAGKKAVRQDRVVAGGPKDFMEVRHLVLKGTNEEIGRALATIAKERYQLKPDASPDRLRTRVQRRYLEKNYPIL